MKKLHFVLSENFHSNEMLNLKKQKYFVHVTTNPNFKLTRILLIE